MNNVRQKCNMNSRMINYPYNLILFASSLETEHWNSMPRLCVLIFVHRFSIPSKRIRKQNEETKKDLHLQELVPDEFTFHFFIPQPCFNEFILWKKLVFKLQLELLRRPSLITLRVLCLVEPNWLLIFSYKDELVYTSSNRNHTLTPGKTTLDYWFAADLPPSCAYLFLAKDKFSLYWSVKRFLIAHNHILIFMTIAVQHEWCYPQSHRVWNKFIHSIFSFHRFFSVYRLFPVTFDLEPC